MGIQPMTPLELALTAVDEACQGEQDGTIKPMLRGMLKAYDRRWAGSQWRPIEGGVEKEFRLPMVNPKAVRLSASRSFDYAGKLDVLVDHPNLPGQRYLIDHKTSSEDIGDSSSGFWERLKLDTQVSTYMLACWQAGIKLDGALWDVIRKPGIRPSKIDKKSAAEIMGGSYCGQKVSHATMVAMAEGKILKETDELFEIRVVDVMNEEPDRYFARKKVPRFDRDLLEHADEQFSIATEIRLARRENVWRKTPESCFEYNRPCQFLGLCSNNDTPDSRKWRRKAQVHAELNGITDNGRSVLTNSSMKCFRACPRRYYFQYELGLERADRFEEPALYFGTIFHKAMEAYWSALGTNHHQPTEGDFDGSSSDGATDASTTTFATAQAEHG